jgi:O-antigen ligase
MNHPPNLASYLTLLIPLALALSLTLNGLQFRLLAALFFLTGSVGLACTLSRVPWVMTAAAVVIVFLGLAWFRDISLKQSLGALAIGIFALMAGLIPVRDKLMDRLSGDFIASVDQRADGIRAATAVIEQSPFIGIGLNNSRLFVEKYLPSVGFITDTEEFLVRDMHVRAFAAMGNAYLYVAVEMGIVGILTLVTCLAGTFIIGWRAICQTGGSIRGAALGLTAGWFGVLGGQTVDHSIFVDPVFYTMALVFALLNLAPALFAVTTSHDER